MVINVVRPMVNDGLVMVNVIIGGSFMLKVVGPMFFLEMFINGYSGWWMVNEF